jgi:hypothetical protein
MRVSASAVVPLAPEGLWDVLVRWEDQARWMRDADEVRVLTAHRTGVGVGLAVRTRVLEVTLWDPPRRLAIGHRGVVRGHGAWTLRPEGSGTRITWSETLSLPVPVLGELPLLAYRPVQRRLMRRSLEGLASVRG